MRCFNLCFTEDFRLNFKATLMTEQQFRTVYPHVINWIRDTLASHAAQAQIVASVRFRSLPLYFSPALLASTKFVAVERVPMPPLSALGLSQFAAFEQGDNDGITYLDTFFVRRYRATDERLHFHELIHVIQWRLLGPERFLGAYADGLEVFGYRNSPLEVMAYDAEEAFVKAAQPFDAERLVVERLGKILTL